MAILANNEFNLKNWVFQTGITTISKIESKKVDVTSHRDTISIDDVFEIFALISAERKIHSLICQVNISNFYQFFSSAKTLWLIYGVAMKCY